MILMILDVLFQLELGREKDAPAAKVPSNIIMKKLSEFYKYFNKIAFQTELAQAHPQFHDYTVIHHLGALKIQRLWRAIIAKRDKVSTFRSQRSTN